MKKAALICGLIACLSSGVHTSFAAHKGNGALDDPAHVIFLQDSIRNNYIAALMMMAEQLTTIMMHQAFVIGTFFDAKHQLELQRYFQEKIADANTQYHPSVQLCSFGTNIRSLAASETQAEANAHILSQRMQERNTLSADTLAHNGPVSDKASRLTRFKETFCNVNANKGDTEHICGFDNDGDAEIDTAGGGPPERVDNDIDYMRTIGSRYTIDADFTDGASTPDEEDVIALTQNLFSHDVFQPISSAILVKQQGKATFQDMRSVQAMRSVINDSHSKLVGMKTHGSPDSTALVADYMNNIMLDLGIPSAELQEFLGDNPSYFAQMEVLTNKMFQHPTFFVNLYQTPENVERTTVAIQALELMHDRDRFEASLRREMLISMMLELALRDKQEAVNNKLNKTFGAFIND